MPFEGFAKDSTRFLSLLVFFVTIVVVGLINPARAGAAFRYTAGTCWIDVGTSSGGTTSYKVDSKLCAPDAGACSDFVSGNDCQDAKVPGSLGATNGGIII